MSDDTTAKDLNKTDSFEEIIRKNKEKKKKEEEERKANNAKVLTLYNIKKKGK